VFFFVDQSTYCSSLYQHCETVRRSIHVVNLDPAAENFDYPVAMGKQNVYCRVASSVHLGLCLMELNFFRLECLQM
jgi:hypothetical protein